MLTRGFEVFRGVRGCALRDFQDRHVRPLRHPSKPTLLVLYEYHARSTPEHTGLFKRLRDRAVYGVPVGLVNTHSRFFGNLQHVGISA